MKFFNHNSSLSTTEPVKALVGGSGSNWCSAGRSGLGKEAGRGEDAGALLLGAGGNGTICVWGGGGKDWDNSSSAENCGDICF